MSKSKYPKHIDTSIELPIARDNVTQITSELFNSLRSAIIQIEKTLGIDPNGVDSITVSERLNQSLDDLGNIKKESINSLNLISGPIVNSDVSENASIDESKLNLDYNTTILYGQNLDIQSQLESFIATINDLSLLINIHLNKLSLSQHNAVQIDVEEATSQPSNIATTALSPDHLQNILEKIYNQHINLVGTNITETNRAHSADQIYFDSKDLVLSSTNVQDAIQEVSGEFGSSLEKQFGSLSSNGRIRFGKDSNPFLGSDYFPKITSTSVSFVLDETQITQIIFSSPQTESSTVNIYDYIELENLSLNVKETFKIQKVNRDGSGNVTGVVIFGSPSKADDGGFSGTVLKNNYNVLNRAGLTTTVRPSYGRSNSPYITLCNPNSATIISSFVNPGGISPSSKNLTIEIDGTPFTIDVYNSSISEQTLESVVFNINTFCVEQKIPLAAFIMPSAFGDELVLSHLIPNFSGDLINRTLKVVLSSSDEALYNLGLSRHLDVETLGSGSNSLFVNGLIKEEVVGVSVFESGSFTHNVGSKKLTSKIGNLLERGIKRGDLIYLELGNTTDAGLFNILSVSEDQIELDYSGYTFTGSAQASDRYIILSNSASLEDLSLEKVSGLNAFILTDTLYFDNKFFLNKRAEYDISNSNTGFEIILVDISKEYLSSNQSVTIDIDVNYNLTLTDIIGNTITQKITSDGYLKVITPDGFSFLTFFIKGYSLLSLSLTSPIFISIFGFDELKEEIYLLSRSTYSYNLGFILGEDSSEGIPKIIDKRLSGTIKSHNISEEFYEKIIEGPRNELRMSGVIRGCEVSNLSYDAVNGIFTFDVTPGVYYSSGIRREFLGVESYSLKSAVSFFGTRVLVFDENGNLFINDNTLYSSDVLGRACTLALIETSGNFFDLRIFINQHDKKIADRFTVGTDLKNSHYIDLQKAINHASLMGFLFGKQMKVSLNTPSYILTKPVILSGLTGIELTSDCSTRLTMKISGQAPILPGFGIDTSANAAIVIKQEINSNYYLKISNICFEADDSLNNIAAFIVFEGSVMKGGRFAIDNCNFYSLYLDNISDRYVIPVLIQHVDSNYRALTTGKETSGFIITNNKFYNVGNEFGLIVQLINSIGNWYGQNIISNNVIDSASPNLGLSSGSYNIYLSTLNITGGTFIAPTFLNLSVTGNTYNS